MRRLGGAPILVVVRSVAPLCGELVGTSCTITRRDEELCAD
jgi:hypothetical protein